MLLRGTDNLRSHDAWSSHELMVASPTRICSISCSMYITATEWKRDFGGHKEVSASQLPRLALDCCSLSFQPFEHPVCTASGQIFELENIVPFVQKYHKNPVTNEPLELGALIKLKFAKNAEGQLSRAVDSQHRSYRQLFTSHLRLISAPLKATYNVR